MPPVKEDLVGNLGRRAALYAINYYKLGQAQELKKSDVSSSLLSALVNLVAGAFSGFKMENRVRLSQRKFDGFLNLVEHIENNQSGVLRLTSTELDKDTQSEISIYRIGDKFCYETRVEAPLFVRDLIISAKRSSSSLQKDMDNGLYFIKTALHNTIYLRNNKKTELVPETIDFYSAVLEYDENITLKKLQDILIKGGSESCPLTIQTIGEKTFICTLLTFLPDTFDQAEFDYVVNKFDFFLKNFSH